MIRETLRYFSVGNFRSRIYNISTHVSLIAGGPQMIGMIS